MSMEDHFKAVDWNRVFKKDKEMKQIKRELMSILMMPVCLMFIRIVMSTPAIVIQFEYLESLGGSSPLVMLGLMAKALPIIMLPCLAYLGYKYLKWSRYDVMRTSEAKPR